MPGFRKRFLSGVAVLSAMVFAAATPAQDHPTEQYDYDIVIRGGRVLDGAGNPCIFADVAIKGGRFVKIGNIQGHGRTEIDATGRYVSPGWVDMMDQSGIALPKNGLAENKLMEGITTAIGGEVAPPFPPSKSETTGRHWRKTESA